MNLKKLKFWVMDELIIVIFYLNLASYVNIPKICVFWVFESPNSFFKKMFKYFY